MQYCMQQYKTFWKTRQKSSEEVSGTIYFLVVSLFKTLIRPSGGGCDAMAFLWKTKKVEGVVFRHSSIERVVIDVNGS